MSQRIQDALKDAGQSVTAPRVAVFEALHASDGPIAPANLAAMLDGQVDRASVYRTIALFKRLQFVREVSAGWRQLIELGDRFDPHHHHLTCLACGRAVVLESDALEKRLAALAGDHGYSLASHQLELTGYCPTCRGR